MATDFPNSPANGATHTFGGTVYTYSTSVGAWTAGSSAGGASVTVSETAPSSPAEGDLWFDPSVLKTFVYYNDGTANQWVQNNPTGGGGSSGGGASVTASDTAPTSPSAGDLWYKSDTNGLYVYYNDGDSSQWVGVSGPAGADGADGAAGAAATGYGQVPIVYTEPPTTHTLNSDGTTSTIQMQAVDPEGTAITYGIAYANSTNALPSQLGSATSINQTTGTYTFTPTTTSSNAGTFKARLSASDGITSAARFVDFDLSFYDFTISPAVSGQSNWTLASGALTLDTAQVYTITPASNMNINAKMWGAGGSTTGNYAGGAGGYASGTIALTGGTSYKIRVGSETGGGTGGSGSGGGYSGIFVTSETHTNSVIIAGGGGGGCGRYSVDQQPGAGGGASGQTGGWVGGPAGGAGGTQSAGGAGSSTGTNRAGTAGSALTGGTGNSAGSYGGGGGGSGYYGGGGGASRVGGDGGNNGMGGGGSGYIGHSSVSSGVNTAGNLGTPGNSSDSARGTAGNPAVAGKVVISASSQE